jgi:GYF domain 2
MSAARARAQRVLRCECGQFVRLDRTLAETRSDPAPALAPESDLADAVDDEETHMFSSLEEIAAFSSASKAAARTSVYEEDDAATRVASSPVNLPSRPSAPPARRSSPPPRPSSPVQRAASTATDKPLWYVDLGGTETVEMTIEQLIIARRSGKLGEGALVWRAGMPRWRPIGSLIPAAGTGAPRQTVPPPGSVQSKPVTSQALGSYERPLATLEFALEKPEDSAPRERPSRTPSPAQPSRSSHPPARALTPVPRVPARKSTPLPTQRPLPPPPSAPPGKSSAAAGALPTPAAPPSTPPPPVARPMASVSPMFQRSSPLPPPRSVVPVSFAYPWRGQRPRWLSVSIAVLICIAASASGAVLVRALKIRHQPLSLSPTPVSATPAVIEPKQPTLAAQPAPPEVTSGTAVVDIDSLSIEHRAPRVQPRIVAPAPPVAQETVSNPDKNAENTDSDDNSPPPVADPPARKAKTEDLPAVAHSNPYTTGSSSDSATKKPAPANSDDPGF